jgi:hypothetical protein
MNSIAERTDKIINYSGYVNTSTEELIEEVEAEDSSSSIDKPFLNDDGEPMITLPALPGHNSNVRSEDQANKSKAMLYQSDKETMKKRCRFVSGDEKFIQEQVAQLSTDSNAIGIESQQ